VRLYGPDPVEPGSSLSHWSDACSPNLVMEPAYTGPNHDPTMELALFKDIGWTIIPASQPVPAANDYGTAAVVLLVLAASLYLLKRRVAAERS